MASFTFEFYPKSLARRTRFDLVVPSLNLHGAINNKDPEYYENQKEAFPLILCLCGFGDNEKAFQQNSAFVSLCEEKKVAACFVNGENKWYLNQGPIDDYYHLLEDDLLDFLYGNFRFLSRKKPLIIRGVSRGGYGALYHYLKNVGKYSACVALSPATKPDFLDESKYGTLRSLCLEVKDKPKNVYLSVGKNDFIINASKDFDQFLIDNEIGFSYRYLENKDHSWNTWRDEIYSVFNYLTEHGFIGTKPESK